MLKINNKEVIPEALAAKLLGLTKNALKLQRRRGKHIGHYYKVYDLIYYEKEYIEGLKQ